MRPVRATYLIPVILGIMLALAPKPVFSADRTVMVFQLQHVSAEAAADGIRPLLSPDGALSVYRFSNSLIVHDAPHVLKQVEEAVRTMDSLPERIEIRTVGISDREFNELGLRVSWDTAGGGWGLGSIEGAGEAAVRVSIARAVERVRVRGGMVSSVHVSPGGSAAVWIQKRHPAAALLRGYLVRQNYLHTVSPFQEAGTGLLLSPVRKGNGGFELRMTPRVGYRSGEDQAYLNIPEASTGMRVPDNRWFVLSGGAATGRDVLSILFSNTATRGKGGINLLMKVRPIR